MENLIVFRAYNSKRQTPVRLSPLEDKTGKLFTGQGKYGYYNLLTEEEKKNLPVIITPETLVSIENGDHLDLNDPIDAANWAWIQKHPYIAVDEDKGRASRDAVFYVDNPEKKAEIHITRDKRITMAKAKVYGASNQKKVQLASALGNPAAQTLSMNMLEDWIIAKVENNEVKPEVIIHLLESKASAKLNAMILFEDLKRYSMVSRHAGTWRFGGSEGAPIGNSDDEVVEYLTDKKNEEQVFIMVEQLKEKKEK